MSDEPTTKLDEINGRLQFQYEACGTEFSVSAVDPPLVASCPGDRCDKAWWIERKAVPVEKTEETAKPLRF